MKTAIQLFRLQQGILQTKTNMEILPTLAQTLAESAIETTYTKRGLTYINIIFTDDDRYSVYGFDEDDSCDYGRGLSGYIHVDGERYSYGECYYPDGYRGSELLALVEAVRDEFDKAGYFMSSKITPNRIELKVRWRL